MSDIVTHTDFADQQKFAGLSTDEKLLEIWLNGRETNGRVADTIRDIAGLASRVGALETDYNERQIAAQESKAVRSLFGSWWAKGTAIVVFAAAIVGNLYGVIQNYLR